MKSNICVKRQSFEIRLNSVISFVFVAFCQPRILRYSARDVTDIFAIKNIQVCDRHARHRCVRGIQTYSWKKKLAVLILPG